MTSHFFKNRTTEAFWNPAWWTDIAQRAERTCPSCPPTTGEEEETSYPWAAWGAEEEGKDRQAPGTGAYLSIVSLWSSEISYEWR